MARGGKKTHQLEDQYGGFDANNANDTFRGGSGFGGGGFKGGGFGGGGKGGPTLKYERVVPKFLREVVPSSFSFSSVAKCLDSNVCLSFYHQMFIKMVLHVCFFYLIVDAKSCIEITFLHPKQLERIARSLLVHYDQFVTTTFTCSAVAFLAGVCL